MNIIRKITIWFFLLACTTTIQISSAGTINTVENIIQAYKRQMIVAIDNFNQKISETENAPKRERSTSVNKKSLMEQEASFRKECVQKIRHIFDETLGIGQAGTQWRGMNESRQMQNSDFNIAAEMKHHAQTIKMLLLNELSRIAKLPAVAELPRNNEAFEAMIMKLLQPHTIDQLEALSRHLYDLRNDIIKAYRLTHEELLKSLQIISSFKKALHPGEDQVTIYATELKNNKMIRNAIETSLADFRKQYNTNKQTIQELSRQLNYQWDLEKSSFIDWEYFTPLENNDIQATQATLKNKMLQQVKETQERFIKRVIPSVLEEAKTTLLSATG